MSHFGKGASLNSIVMAKRWAKLGYKPGDRNGADERRGEPWRGALTASSGPLVTEA
jgi:hypothetical protein